MDRKKEKYLTQMDEIKTSAESDLAIIQARYNQLINNASKTLDSMEGSLDREDGDDFEGMDHMELMRKGEEVKKKSLESAKNGGIGFDSQIDEINEIEVGDPGFDPKEEELMQLKDLFSKMKLNLQMGELDHMKEFYQSSENIKDQLWEDLQAKETEIDDYKLAIKLKKEKIAELKKKKKTNKEFIAEDKAGYRLACKIVGLKDKNKQFIAKNEDLDDEIVRIDRFVDSVMGETLKNVDKFWKHRVKVLAKRAKNKKAESEQKVVGEEDGDQGAEDAGNGKKEDKESVPAGDEAKGAKKEEEKNKESKEKPAENNEAQEGENEENPKQGEDVTQKEDETQKEGENGAVEDQKQVEKEEGPKTPQLTARQKELLEIKKIEFKKDIIDLQVSEKELKDQDLRHLKSATDSFVTRDVGVLKKIKWLEKLTEDVNLLTNFIKNKKVDASNIQSLHKPKEKRELELEEVDKDITGTTYSCKKNADY